MGLFDSLFGGGGGGYDTSAMVAATEKANALNEKIYEETKVDNKPWLQAGTSAVGRLMTLLGLSGGEGAKTREQLATELTPKYTTKTGPAAGAPTSYDLMTVNDLSPEHRRAIETYRPDLLDSNAYQAKNLSTQGGKYGSNYEMNRVSDINSFLTNQGSFGPTTEAVDQAALNAAIEAELAGQTTPDDYGYLSENFGAAEFEADPGAEFRRKEGEKAIERFMASKGKTYTPEAAKALVGFNSDTASQEYGASYDRDNANKTRIFNMLAGVSGFGQTASAQNTASGANYATNTGNNLMGLANAQTAASVAKASKPSMFSQILSAGAQAAGAYYSDARLKDFQTVDTVDGIDRVRFNYKGSSRAYLGALAQQVAKVIPEAVSVAKNGFLMVDYSKLPFRMEPIHAT